MLIFFFCMCVFQNVQYPPALSLPQPWPRMGHTVIILHGCSLPSNIRAGLSTVHRTITPKRGQYPRFRTSLDLGDSLDTPPTFVHQQNLHIVCLVKLRTHKLLWIVTLPQTFISVAKPSRKRLGKAATTAPSVVALHCLECFVNKDVGCE